MHLGNDSKYDLKNITPIGDSKLTNKKLLCLGSSVTFGETSQHIAFGEYISKRNNMSLLKEAVSGTTLVDIDDQSYVARLKRLDKNFNPDIFICQLSTNDATKNLCLGNIDDQIPDTISGAINYIINYVKEHYHLLPIFYTNPKYDNDNYQKMINRLYEIKKITNIKIIDMFNNENFNNISDEDRKLYMVDDIHPSKAGYLLWWTPYFEKKLKEYIDE